MVSLEYGPRGKKGEEELFLVRLGWSNDDGPCQVQERT